MRCPARGVARVAHLSGGKAGGFVRLSGPVRGLPKPSRRRTSSPGRVNCEGCDFNPYPVLVSSSLRYFRFIYVIHSTDCTGLSTLRGSAPSSVPAGDAVRSGFSYTCLITMTGWNQIFRKLRNVQYTSINRNQGAGKSFEISKCVS